MNLRANTPQAVVRRVVLGVVVSVPVTGLALMHLGWASAIGLVFAVPAVYLIQAAVQDCLALLRTGTLHERPRYLWFLLGGIACVAYWSTVFW